MPSQVHAFVFLGLIGLAVVWMPLLLKNVPISLPMVAVAFGFVIFTIEHGDITVIEYRRTAELLTQLALIVAVMGAGLKIDRPFAIATWTSTWRLLGLVMPLSIMAIALCAMWLLNLPLGMAILLGGILAPTDPVLAASVQVGPPGTGEEGEVRFALTSEAGLNDGLAFPFVTLGILITQQGLDPSGWLVTWVVVDVVWKIAAAVAIGAGVGWGLVLADRWLPKAFRLAQSRDGFASVAVTFLVYGLAEIAHSYGFVGVFAAAVAIRNTSKALDYHRRLNDFAEQVERFATVLVLVLFGGAIADGQLATLSWAEALFGVLVLVAIRPVTAFIGFIGSPQPISERRAFAYFGIRGLGSLYYAIYATNHLGLETPVRLWTVVTFVVVLSVVLYGTSAERVMHRLGQTRDAGVGSDRSTQVRDLS